MDTWRRRTIACIVTLSAMLVASGCEKKKKPTTGPSGSASAAVKATASAAPKKKPPFEELVNKSTPLSPTPKAVEVEGTKVSAEHCKLEGASFLFKSALKVLKAIEVVGDKAYLVDDAGTVHGFKLKSGDGCVLTSDESFGQGGKLKLAKRVDALTRDAKGHLIASSFGFANHFMKDGEVLYACPTKGLVRLNPRSNWGVSSYANAPVHKLTYGKEACTEDAWALADLGKPETRKGPFSNINTVGFVDDLVLVGGVLADKVENRLPKVVVAYDAKGEEKFRFGNTDKTARVDNFGWVHGIAACKPGICVLDSNYRRLTLWKKDGTFIGLVKLGDLFGLRYPWVPAMTSVKGTLYFAAGQDRGPKSGVAEGLVFRVTME